MGIIATLWVAFIVVVFSLPTLYPVTGENLNYAGAAADTGSRVECHNLALTC